MIRKVVNAVALIGLLVVLAGWTVFLRPTFLGGPATYVVVRGDSMLPLYKTGDLVVLRAAAEYERHDIVAYRVPAGQIGGGHIVVHRIVGGDPKQGYLVKGDNNSFLDPWMPHRRDMVGKPWLLLPGVGRVIAYLQKPVIAAGIAAALMVMFVMARQPRRPRGPIPAGAGRRAGVVSRWSRSPSGSGPVSAARRGDAHNPVSGLHGRATPR